MIPDKEFEKRRRRFLRQMGHGVAVLPAAPVAVRNSSVEHDYRQDSDLHFLTGLDEPECALVLTNERGRRSMILFVRPSDPERELWEGPRLGCDGAKRRFGADEAYPIQQLPDRLPELLANMSRLFYRLGNDREFDQTVLDALNKVRKRAREGIVAPREIVDTGLILHEMRLRKSRGELTTMATAAKVTAEAHLRAMQLARPGRYEYEIEAEILRTFRAHGCKRTAFETIVASGPNATVLHYTRNDRVLQDGELLLVDAGAEYGYYASDVTRTFPVSGTFTQAQRAVYDVVLSAQQAAIDKVRPGITLNDVHRAALRVLTKGMIDLGLIKGPLQEALDKGRYKRFYMHRTSHWLGMDVHDAGDYYCDGKARPLQPGFVFTVEPGIYIGANARVAKRFRNIGVRIEDDIAVTAQGCRNLTRNIPKCPRELEKIVAG